MPKIVYFWFGLSLALMAAETFMPGAFLLWFGFAAAALGVLTWLLPDMPVMAQPVTFGVLSIISIYAYRRWFRGKEPQSDQPLLNKRVDQMLGRTYELHEPIKNGYGKIKVNDRLAAELFQIVAEGLSNVRRHAFCRDARVEISCQDSSLLLQIKNSRPRTGGNPDGEPRDGHDGVKSFRPHSIAERAASLGGDTQVFVDDKDYTVVSVGIPL
jgi:hypothetical protein